MPQVRMTTDVYKRLQEYADGRPLGKAVELLLDAEDEHLRNWPGPKMITRLREETGEDGARVVIPEMGAFQAQPLDAQGIPPDRGKVSVRGTGRNVTSLDSVPVPPANVSMSPPFEPGERKADLCTCGPSERARGKHNKWCPARVK